jgi:predicted phosphodiesterase
MAEFEDRLGQSEARVQDASVPKGWEPYSEYSDQIGEAIVRLPKPNATDRDLLISAGFDPDSWKISGPINVRKWMRFDQEWLYYYKFSVEAGESPEVVQAHVDDLVAKIRDRQPPLKAEEPINEPQDDAFVFFASDWQVGKAEGAIGTDQTIERVLEGIDQTVVRVKELRGLGRTLKHGAFIGMGDIVEGCTGNYPGQAFLIDRNRRDQNKIARELITYGIDSLAPLFEEFTVACVHGNHGEHREGGRKVTDDADNDDTACFEAVKTVYDRIGWDINWVIPNDEMSVALELGGVKIGLTHGHVFRKGATAQLKQLNWWMGQDFGFQPVRGAQILFTAHFHHFLATEVGKRTMFQCPAADPGSKWFRDGSGEDAPPGFLTIRLSSDELMGYSDVQVLRPSR